MKAVMYGGGNIGRGFIGTLFSKSGYNVTFIDVVNDVVNRLNAEHHYPVRIISENGYEDVDIKNVDAVNGNDSEAVADVIAAADIMATAVGAKILKFIAPNIAMGLKKRFEITKAPLDIIVCENLMDADKVLKGLIMEHLDDKEKELVEERVGFVEASIGRMVPVQTEEMKDGDPMRVCVEKYRFLPVDKAAFKGNIPNIEGLVPFTPFDFYIKRKLFLHNMGHSVCAYLGGYIGKEYIYEAIDNPDILAITENAMLESAVALSAHYGIPLEKIVLHIKDLLCRFRNSALKDTCKRVGADPARKLDKSDRLVGATLLAESQGTCPSYIPIGIAGAIYRYINENEALSQSVENADKILREVCKISKEDIIEYTLSIYKYFLAEEGVDVMRRAAERHSKFLLDDIV